ncbi:hypothetical protein EV421DRAFT_2033251 [Armillaria borealis]|uniref:Protein kinase domain-containing protein n=1 Tax=Armillaria borealis TaxID=47425 RepID=A0AA39MVG8_9AGAR|nr:hypothetical protein EV421DRAFT_2033251 [Armillaria borealis]
MSESMLTLPTAQKSWANLDSILVAEIRKNLRTSFNPWQQINAVPKLVEQVVVNVLQQELDVATPGDEYFTVCRKSLRALSEKRDIFPESFQCTNIIKKEELPFSGGASADVWKGEMDGRPVCLKVLRIFTSKNQVEKILKQLRREAIVWRQLRHGNILPFIGINCSYFTPSYCLISPWMNNGSLISFLELHPDHDRLHCVRDIANAVEFMHSLDPEREYLSFVNEL